MQLVSLLAQRCARSFDREDISFSNHSHTLVVSERVVGAGFAFISVEYRLIPPASAHKVVEDIQDLFCFLSSELNSHLCSLRPGLQVDPSRIAVTGSSAGGLCAYLSVMHARPKPKAVVGMYAMGGNLLVSHATNSLTCH